MIPMPQDQLEASVLRFLFDYSQTAVTKIRPDQVANNLGEGFSEARVRMALSSLEQKRLARGAHNAMSGSSYEISEDGLRQVGAEIDASASLPAGDTVPASDRLVSLSHNQSVEIEKPLQEVIRELDADNGLPEDPIFRQRVLGQLRAGGELVRAGEFKLALFHLTVVTALNELAVRYRDGVIAGLATNLLQYLITNGFSQ